MTLTRYCLLSFTCTFGLSGFPALAEQAPPPESAATAAATTAGPPAAGADRIDRIRSIVSEALDAEQQPARAAPPAVQQPVADTTARQRLEDLREAVSQATSANRPPADRYVSTLQREGDRTVVIDAATSRQPAVVAAVPSTPSLAPAPDDAMDGGTTYQVRTGDSLWRIAERFYNDGYQFQRLYDANRDRISDMNLLVIGQLLRIP